MTLDDLKKHFGNGNQFELKTGMSHANWNYWFKKSGYIPIESQLRIEYWTNGALKARLEDLPEGYCQY